MSDPMALRERCGRGERCVAAEPLDPAQPKSPMVGAPLTARAICPACEREVDAVLRAAPRIHRELDAASLEPAPTTPQDGHRRGKLIGSPLGITLAPYDLAEQLHWWITAWADVVIYTAGRPAVDRARQPAADQITDACALLRRYLSVWISHQPVEFQVARADADPDNRRREPTDDTVTVELAGWEGCARLIDWRDATDRVLGELPTVHYPPEPCPRCDQTRALRRRDGDDKVWCVNCGGSWTMDRFETHAHSWIGGAA